MSMKPILIAAFLLILWPLAVFSQTVCISQDAANKCAENARVVPALEAKIATLEQGLKDKDVSIEELKAINKTNVADLERRLNETTNKLATATGQLVGAESMVVRLTAMVDFMLKNGREKCYAIICIQ